MDNIMNILGVIFEGIIAILTILMLFVSKFREFIFKKYQNTLDKSLEDRKSSNERVNYVSKVRFDKEFDIYEKLNNLLADIVYKASDISTMFLHKKVDKIVNLDEQIKEFHKLYNNCDKELRKKGIFINVEMYNAIKEQLKMTQDLVDYENFFELVQKHKNIKYKNDTFNFEELCDLIKNKQREVSDSYNLIIINMRKYLETLVIKDKD